MDNLQKFTTALDVRLGQLRIDVLNDFAASIKEEEKSFFDSVPDGIPFPKGGIGLAHENQYQLSESEWQELVVSAERSVKIEMPKSEEWNIGHDNIGGHEVEKGAAFDEELHASAETFINRVKEAQGEDRSIPDFEKIAMGPIFESDIDAFSEYLESLDIGRYKGWAYKEMTGLFRHTRISPLYFLSWNGVVTFANKEFYLLAQREIVPFNSKKTDRSPDAYKTADYNTIRDKQLPIPNS